MDSNSNQLSNSKVILTIFVIGIVLVFFFYLITSNNSIQDDKSVLSTDESEVSSNLSFNLSTNSSGPQYLISTDNAGNLTNTPLIVNHICPIGSIMLWSTSAPPNGWLLCDGAEYLKNDERYRRLGEVLGITYGNPSSNDKFKVPDLRGRVPIGVGSGINLTSRVIGQNGGSETHALTIAEMPAHTHNWNNQNWGLMHTGENMDYTIGGVSDTTSWEASLNDPPLRNFDVSSVGGGAGHPNMQPFLVLNYIIKF